MGWVGDLYTDWGAVTGRESLLLEPDLKESTSMFLVDFFLSWVLLVLWMTGTTPAGERGWGLVDLLPCILGKPFPPHDTALFLSHCSREWDRPALLPVLSWGGPVRCLEW